MLQEKESAKTNKQKKFYQKKVDRDAKKRYWQIPLDERVPNWQQWTLHLVDTCLWYTFSTASFS